jgi:pimeloyl-ACP methyl ester carboxylesterase
VERRRTMTSVTANGIQIEYETFGNTSSPALLLIIGLGSQLLHWQDEFCQKIADSGYYVIRYDNRDVGLSTKFEGLSSEETMEKVMALLSGQNVSVPYTMEDMANDAVGLLDALGIKKFHICGMSMGGMVAQTLAIAYPSRVLSLISVYSQCGNRPEYVPTEEILEVLMKPAPEDREAYIQYMVNIYKLTYGSGLPFDEDFHRDISARAFDRSFYPEGSGRQYLAMLSQKDRGEDLKKLDVPSLIIQGDDDPLIPIAAGRDIADAIPGAEFIVVKGMGHAVPNLNAYWDDIKDAMLEHMGKVQF